MHEVLLIERMGGVSVEAPTRMLQRWLQLQEQIVDALLSWHRIDSHGLVGSVDSTQESHWVAWFTQRVEVLWSTLVFLRPETLTMKARQVLFRRRQNLAHFFDDFDDPCVLVHGNLSLRNMLKQARSDELLAIINLGIVLWAPREYDLFRLSADGPAGTLLFRYLQQAPVAEWFIARRWRYMLWDEMSRLIQTGQFDRARVDRAAALLLPWLN